MRGAVYGALRRLHASPRMHAVFENPPVPIEGMFRLTLEPGLGLRSNEAELTRRRIPIE